MPRRLPLAIAVVLAACASPGPEPQPTERVVLLDQGLSAEERAVLHFTPQGTEIMPASWLASLRVGPTSERRLMDPEVLERFRFIRPPAADAHRNPDGFPLGFAVHTHRGPGGPPEGVRMVGFTCAACHTGQINHRGTAILIEGGAAMHDAVAFQRMMAEAMVLTAELGWKRERFLDEVMRREPWPGGREALARSLDVVVARIKARKDLEDRLTVVPEGHGRLDALQRIANQLLGENLDIQANERPRDAPVSFPPVWDIWLFDWVQYNASVRQPMVRNVGEALGVRARTNFVDGAGHPVPPPARWDSSVLVREIDLIERMLSKLRPPPWPEEVLGPVDRAEAARGRALFAERCAGCHGIQVIRGTANPPEWHVPLVPLARVGTDPNAARGFAGRRYDASPLGFTRPIGSAEALRVVTEAVKDRAYDRLTPPATPAERAALDGFGRENLVRAPCGYKARLLIGIWATAPFLHNGSVPTLHDLLSPTRPEAFVVGDREFDPVKVGYRTDRAEFGTVFDTRLPGNSNQGHWFRDGGGPGVIGRAFVEDERRAVIAYLKVATVEDYPTRMVDRPGPAACEGDATWAMR
jgi:mono/diheme cytochrome c family protein